MESVSVNIFSNIASLSSLFSWDRGLDLGFRFRFRVQAEALNFNP
jgi:hypothetical protein